MTDLRAVSLLPLVPSGSDYDASRRLFADLGFQTFRLTQTPRGQKNAVHGRSTGR